MLAGHGSTQSNDESQYSHGGGQLTSAVALVDNANLLIFLSIVLPALADDGTKYNDGKHLQKIISSLTGTEGINLRQMSASE